MSFGFGMSDVEYIAKLGLRLRNFVRSIKDAPRDFDALRAEADCLKICFHVIEYRDCASVLRHVTHEQAEDLRTIMRSCEANMQELIKFVAQCQRITIDSAGGKPANKSLWECFKEQGKRLWAKVQFVGADKQPMRDKLAIPTQSLNIYLVSLSFVSLSYRTRLSGAPHGPLPVPPKGIANWDLVGQSVAFKQANFEYSDLMKPGIEDAIVECALRIVNGGSCCEKCKHDEDKGREKKPGGPIQIRVPRRPQRRSSLSKGIRNNRSGMYLVRSKTPARSRSRTRSSVELVKTIRGYKSDSDSGSGDFDVHYISPHRLRSRARRYTEESNYADEAQSPHQDFSARPEPFEERRRSRAFDQADDEEDDEEDEEDAEMRDAQRRGDARRRGHDAARAEIQKERKEAIDEMTKGFKEETRASRGSSRANFMSGSTQPDIRTYMEVTYGVIMNRAPPEVERINASRSRTPEGPQLFQAKTSIDEDVGDSDIYSDPDSEPRVILVYAEREPRSRVREESPVTSFAIPDHEYIPRTEVFEGHHTFMADREREQSLREREMSFRNREASLREREVALRERERSLRDRQRPMAQHDMSFPPHDGEIPIATELGRPERERVTRFDESDLHLSPEDHERRIERRTSSRLVPEDLWRPHMRRTSSHIGPEDLRRPHMRRTSSHISPGEMHLSPEDLRRQRMRRPGSYSGPDIL
ncbi:hypothetical protein GJ744_011597 [Endocarpon pusillum]|uniref:Uncharacterized protein n=1 Tax=Endocarpon pusillum TaxID=364733 RepID=A0A8H7E2R0_9EURO|nr:hypothetical protein GJ744_011597 [Endocarpon pusillum]